MDWPERIGRRIKLRDLHVLLAVVQSGSITKAAQELAISQPVVSKVVADLERVLGVRLLDRDRHGAQATIYGAALLKRGIAAFDELKQGVKDIAFLKDAAGGELRLGASGVMAEGLLPAILNRLRRDHPLLTIDIAQAFAGPALYRELRDRNVDLIVGRMNLPIDDDLAAEVLFDDPLLVVAGPGNPLLRRRKLELGQLLDEPWILPQAGAARTVIEETFAACQLRLPRADVVSSSLALHEAMLASGPLLAIWPASVLLWGARRHFVRPLPVRLPDLPRPVGIVTLKRRMIGPLAQLFIDSAREVARSIQKDRPRQERVQANEARFPARRRGVKKST
jgi:DNA-binding transcriptional LysR family regulator